MRLKPKKMTRIKLFIKGLANKAIKLKDLGIKPVN